MTRRLLPYGDTARLLECGDLEDSRRLLHWLHQQDRPEISGIVPGARTLLLQLSAPLPTELAGTLIEIEPPPVPAGDAGLVAIDVRYDGPDLAALAERLGLDAEELINHHTGQDWVVAFCGFSPGFGYLSPTERPLPVPRRASPRTRVPAGSVALADHWSAVYPAPSPGGWQLIGSTDAPLFDVTAEPPAVLAPGTRVRFRRLTP
ncbi:allophanate hydrolase subunit 1 [Microlunatus sp. Gsoil 973]|uniref:5-oxoprolinase subunit B family protein n=1 Tax=Microlunatus sp. Gsoil 973 TaxID=2672569 RepID=UPI0012B4E6A1|nr:allophanate hydrolase subunit 1 [Microlunatus sp. Gsoil 973]QGN35201.1 carboxyltransferase domain-containing protein [Microlunatus sp. Gsoil 973]